MKADVSPCNELIIPWDDSTNIWIISVEQRPSMLWFVCRRFPLFRWWQRDDFNIELHERIWVSPWSINARWGAPNHENRQETCSDCDYTHDPFFWLCSLLTQDTRRSRVNRKSRACHVSTRLYTPTIPFAMLWQVIFQGTMTIFTSHALEDFFLDSSLSNVSVWFNLNGEVWSFTTNGSM